MSTPVRVRCSSVRITRKSTSITIRGKLTMVHFRYTKRAKSLLTLPPAMGRIHSATPLRAVLVQSVVIMGGTLAKLMPAPLISPTATPVSTTAAAPKATCAGLSVFISLAATQVHTLMVDPTDMSIPPEMITSVCPNATQASGTHWVIRLVMLYSERKDSDTRHITANTTSSRP